MAELAVGPIMKKIIDTCSGCLGNDYVKDYFKDYLKDQLRWQTGMKEELERLRDDQPKIQAVLFSANQAQIISDQNPALNTWIWQLRDAIDEADDALDDFEYMKHEEQLTKNTGETKKRKFTSYLFESVRKILKIGERVLKIDPTLNRLEEAVKKLDKVSADVTTFLHLLDSAKQEQKEQEINFYKTRETGYLPKNDLIGRGKEMELVLEWLRNPSNEHQGTDLYRNISLLSIVGHGGMGKTTLLQHLYKDEEIKKEFHLKMWVCVSNNFDVKKVIADMLECLKAERPRLDTLVALQRSLEEELMSKKFLLVLDDIWEEEEERDQSKWENVLAPLASGSFGSKILVTTRTDSVALMFTKLIQKKVKILRLEGLEEDECLQLLNSHAFAGVENPSDGHKKLSAIAGEMVKKLLGSPLAAKVIGGVLNDNLDERHWRTVLESNLLGQNSVNSILRLSYIVLPNPLKSCFAFCGMFVQDHPFDKDDLIRMWIALGFIQPSLDQAETMEDIGGRYFDGLVKKSFFDKFEYGYKMHDVLHELAQSVFTHECLRVDDSTKLSSQISETLRHFSVQTTNINILRKIEKFKHLHSLFLFYEGSNQDLCSALVEIFKASRCLRLLYIRTEMIPEEIRYLKHLRYLKIKGVDVTRLPRSLSNLYHLQYIIYNPWVVSSPPEVDDFFPSDINHLSNLRYLKLPENYISLICGIGKLNSLQELKMYDLRDANGYRIGELANMNDLCKLGINCLENVKDAKEACSAKLCAKRRLTDLTLCWSWNHTYSSNTDLDENVLDNVQPPKCLRKLNIKGYMGARSAIWMKDVNLISNLEKIQLDNCVEWETLPPFGQLPFLKSLKLSGMPKVKWLESKFNGNDIYHAFPLLEKLYISGLQALEDWFEAGVAAEDECLFPCLIQLTLLDCPKLKELPSLPPKLESLEMKNTGWKTLKFCSNSNHIPLESLRVFDCPNIISLLLGDELAKLAALRYLTIMNCPNLISLGRHREVQITSNCHLILEKIELRDCLECETLLPFGLLPFLKSLTLSGMPKVKWLESKFNGNDKYHAFSLLEKLYINGLEALEDWFEAGVAAEDGCLFPCLIELDLFDCPKLKELPSLPPKLKSLNIERIGWKTLNFCSNSNPIPLETLEVFNCPNITSLPLADEIARLAALSGLTIENCPNLISLGRYRQVETTNHLILSDLSISDPLVLLMEPLRSIASLKKLSIRDNDELVSFSNEAEQWFLKVWSSLSELQFAYLKSLQSLPSSLESLSSLQFLKIRSVPMLRELPNLPLSLRSLSIRYCHPELKERYEEDGGSDRHKIAHIPNIDIRP